MSDDEIYEYLGQQFEWNREKALKNWMEHESCSRRPQPFSLIRARFIMKTTSTPLRKNGMLWLGIPRKPVNCLSYTYTGAKKRD